MLQLNQNIWLKKCKTAPQNWGGIQSQMVIIFEDLNTSPYLYTIYTIRHYFTYLNTIIWSNVNIWLVQLQLGV